MARNKRTKDQIRADRAEIARLYLRGVTQAEIAARLAQRPRVRYQLTQQMISYDLKQIRKAWLQSSIRDFDELAAEQLAKIDYLELTYWAAWEKSLEDQRTEHATAKPDRNGTPRQVQAVYTTQQGRGDPRYLQGIERCIEQRCKLLGLYQPDKLDVTSGGQPVGKVFEEALARVYGDPAGDGDDGDDDSDDGDDDGAGQQPSAGSHAETAV